MCALSFFSITLQAKVLTDVNVVIPAASVCAIVGKSGIIRGIVSLVLVPRHTSLTILTLILCHISLSVSYYITLPPCLQCTL